MILSSNYINIYFGNYGFVILRLGFKSRGRNIYLKIKLMKVKRNLKHL